MNRNDENCCRCLQMMMRVKFCRSAVLLVFANWWLKDFLVGIFLSSSGINFLSSVICHTLFFAHQPDDGSRSTLSSLTGRASRRQQATTAKDIISSQ
jgi:hypothetical protein